MWHRPCLQGAFALTDLKHESVGLPESPVSSTDGEEHQEGKITSYQGGFGCIFIELHPCFRHCTGNMGLTVWQTRRARTPIVLAFIRVVGRTSMLTVVCRSWHGLRRERSAMADGMCWGRGRCPALSSASQLLHSSSWMTFRLVFSHFWLHYEQMTSLPTWRTQSLHGAVCHQCPCLLLCFFLLSKACPSIQALNLSSTFWSVITGEDAIS